MDDHFDNEIEALLSAYAAGTLTPDEQKRLFEKSLNNQQLFDALADEEAMRAALATPLVKESLIDLLDETDREHREIHLLGAAQAPAPLATQRSQNMRLLWATVAACLLFGIISAALWPTKSVVQVSEVKQQPVLVAENKPAPEPLRTPVPTARSPLPQRPAEKARRTSSPQPIQEKLADQPPAAPAVAPELKAKKEMQDAKASVESRADAAPPAPKQSIAVSADTTSISTTAERQANRFNAPAGKLGAAASAIAKAAPIAAISRNNLAINTATNNRVYAFLLDGATIRVLAPTDDAKRLYPLGDHSTQAEVWLIVTPVEDPVLERALTGVLPLPSRNWTKLKTNP